jgi:hypothetical protein
VPKSHQRGWLPGLGSTPTAEDIRAHLKEVVSTEPFMIPMSLVDEIRVLAERIGLGR